MNKKLYYLSGVLIFFILQGFLYAQGLMARNALYELTEATQLDQRVFNWFFSIPQLAAVSSEQIIFFNDSGRETLALPPQYFRTNFSKNGRFFAVQTLNPRESLERVDRQLEILVYSDLKKESYKLIRQQYYDHSFPSVNLADSDGALVLGENDSGELWFYDGKGQLLKQVILFPQAEYDLEKILDVDISGDGSRVAVVAGKRGGSPAGSSSINPSAEPQLFLFTRDGIKLWQQELPDFNSNEVVISPDGQLIAANSFTISIDGKLFKRTIIFQQDGTPLSQTEILFKQARFSEDSQYLLLADNHEVQMLNAITGILQWSNKIPGRTSLIVDLDIAAGGEKAAVLVAVNEWNGNQFFYQEPVVLIYDARGEEIQKISFSENLLNRPAVRFTNQDKTLLLALGNAFYRYQQK